jgi:hypothetical protein
MKKLYNILALLVVLALIFATGFFFGHRNAEKNAPVPQVDTLTIRDTIIDYKPTAATTPAGYELVPTGTLDVYEYFLNAYKDSLERERKPTLVTVHDTTYIAVPLSRSLFTDHKTYECEVEGYGTKMLWHKSFQETNYITNTLEVPTLPKLAISPDLSAFASKNVLGVSAGVRLDVWSGKWRFSPMVGYALIKDSQAWSYGPALSFSANYTFILK